MIRNKAEDILNKVKYNECSILYYERIREITNKETFCLSREESGRKFNYQMFFDSLTKS